MDQSTEIQDMAGNFGFDSATGIDLPNEGSGYVLTANEKAALHDQNPAAWPYRDWFTGDSVQLAIGQNAVAVTPIQLAGAYSALANGGTVYQPHVAAQVLLPTSPVDVPLGSTDPANLIRTIEPVVRSSVPFPAGTRDPIVAGLSQVTKEGTASAAFLGFDQNAFPIVGKTGTAQVEGKADSSVFAAYAPADGPQYTVAAVLEESGFGSEAAAPVARHVFEVLSGQTQTGYSIVAPDVD
jgi:penicillin-binding protein 2